MLKELFRFVVFFACVIGLFAWMGVLLPIFTNPVMFTFLFAFILIVVVKLVLRAFDE